MIYTKKKGQLAANFAVWIFGIIVVVLILLLGFKLIGGNKEEADRVVVENFKKTISKDVNALSAEYGSQILKEYKVPKGVEYMCVYDRPAILDAQNANVNLIGQINNLLLKDLIESGSSTNAFIMINDEVEQFDAGNIELAYPYYNCMDVEDGQIKYVIKGKGDHTLLVPIPTLSECQNAQNAQADCSILMGFFTPMDDPILIELCQSEYGLC